jgi:hypothetical protein
VTVIEVRVWPDDAEEDVRRLTRIGAERLRLGERADGAFEQEVARALGGQLGVGHLHLAVGAERLDRIERTERIMTLSTASLNVDLIVREFAPAQGMSGRANA